MSIFKKAENQSAYLKCGILGFAGSGKSFTAMKIAIGLQKFCKSTAPVNFIDTETGSDFLIHKFKENGIELFVSKSRAFVDLLSAVDESEKAGSILIIDSISHFWTELMESFKKRRNIDRLFFQHWGPIKEEWREFTDKFVNSKCHIIMCGRAGWEYDYEEDSEGVKELHKTGTKMKAETEMGYEPSLLIEMEKVKNQSGSKIGGEFLHRAWVLKDRFDIINGKFFDNPDFASIEPHIKMLNIGGEHMGVDKDRNSVNLWDSNSSYFVIKRQKDIALEELIIALDKFCDPRSDAGKKARIAILEDTFGTASKTAIEVLDLTPIIEGVKKIKEKLSMTQGLIKPEPNGDKTETKAVVNKIDGIDNAEPKPKKSEKSSHAGRLQKAGLR